MATRAAEGPGLGAAAKEVAERASALVRLELELASLELKRKVAKLGIGIGLGAGALLLVLFGLGFALAGAAAAIATALPTWAALLIVAGGLVLVAGLLGTMAVGALKSASPAPRQAIEEAKLTTDRLRSANGR